MKAYLINLDRSHERLDHMTATFDALGLAFERIAGFNGFRLTHSEIDDFSRNGYLWSPGEIGCMISHYAIWQRVADSGDKHAAIFEDDIRVSWRLPHVLDGSIPVPDDADLVKLETMATPVDLGRTVSACGFGIDLRRLYSKHLGSAGYIISRVAAQRLVRSPDLMMGPVDHTLFYSKSPIRQVFTTYQCVPGLVIQDAHDHAPPAGHLGFGSLIGLGPVSRHSAPVGGMTKLKREILRPFRNLAMVTGRFVTRLRHDGRTEVVPFAGDGVLDHALPQRPADAMDR